MNRENIKEVKYGLITIWFPDCLSTEFEIFEDLAMLFDVEYQNIAVLMLKSEMKKHTELKSKTFIDFEADNTQISTKNANDIIIIGNIINDLTKSNIAASMSEAEKEIIKNEIMSFKKSKKFKWSEGNIFSLKLDNNTFMFGQVISTHLVKSPVCALFELYENYENIRYEKLKHSRIISILNTDGECLENGSFHVVLNGDILVSNYHPSDTSRSTGDSILLLLGNAYCGLHPWNVYASETYFDNMLIKGISRPTLAKILDKKERAEYRL